MIESKEKVTKFEDILKNCTTIEEKNNEANDGNVSNDQGIVDKNKKQKKEVPRGKPKSGRVWKEPKQRFKSIVKTKGIRSSFDMKQKLREDLKKVKEMSKEIKAQQVAEKEAKKERRRENLKRAEVNSKKSEIFQVIKNTAKIKRMKKKQLRQIEKRDTVKAQEKNKT